MIKNFKRLAMYLISTFLCGPLIAESKPMLCPFNDHFIIQSVIPVKILHANINGNLSYTSNSKNTFDLGCADDSDIDSGDLYIDIGVDDYDRCSMVIHDGPYEWRPSVTEMHCRGQAGLDFDSITNPAYHVWQLNFIKR